MAADGVFMRRAAAALVVLLSASAATGVGIGRHALASTDPGPGRLETLHLPSADGDVATREVEVYRPGVPDSTDLPILYLLHGDPGSAEDFLGVGLADALDRWVAAGGPPFVVVSPDGNGIAHTDTEWADSADGADRLESFLTKVVIPTVEGQSPRDRVHRAIGGFSMGGYGAMNLGLRHPDLFGQVVSISGYFGVEDPDGVFAGQPDLVAANQPDAHAAEANALRIALFEGADDDEPDIKGEAARMAGVLADAGVPASLVVAPGRHDLVYVASQFPAVFQFLSDGWVDPTATSATSSGSVAGPGPRADLAPLDAVQSTTAVHLTWTSEPSSPSFDAEVRDGEGPWVRWMSGVAGSSADLHGLADHRYTVRVRAVDGSGLPGPWSDPVSTRIASDAARAQGFAAAYVVAARGGVDPVESPPASTGGLDIPIMVGVAVTADGGYALDRWGGIHPFGGRRAPSTSDSAYWPGWDIARGIAVNPDGGSGYVLDAWGGLHPFGGAAPVEPSGYWPGQDLARAVVLTAASTAAHPAGEVLDASGGVHSFGDGPDLGVVDTWPGRDLARGLALNSDGRSGYVLDGWGGLHPVGNASPVASSAFWPDWDIARGLALVPGSRADAPAGEVLDGFGGLHAFGSAPLVTGDVYWGQDVATGLAVAA
ncbi:MAG: alpha/beta hydrolase [Acidimicrobiales bacterium]